METVLSAQNARVKWMKSLQSAKGREAAGCLLAEGVKLCAEAVRDAEVALMIGTEKHLDLLARAEASGADVLIAPERVLEAVCDARAPQGVAAAVRIPALRVPDGAARLLALDGVQDPGNVGTMLRTAEAAGFDGALLSPDCADAYAPKTVRATMGSIYRLPTLRGELPALLAARAGYAVVSAELGGEALAKAAREICAPLILVIGSEGRGVSEAVRALATRRVALPMRGRAESLNAAVAAGILLYALSDGDDA